MNTDKKKKKKKLKESPTPQHACAEGAVEETMKGTRVTALSDRMRVLRQSRTDSVPFMERTQNPVTFVGQAAFHGDWAATDAPPGADGGNVSVRMLDARSMAGTYRGMQPVNPNPGDGSRPYAPAQLSATPPNGSHDAGSQYYSHSHAVPITTVAGNRFSVNPAGQVNQQHMKASRLDVMRAAMRRES